MCVCMGVCVGEFIRKGLVCVHISLLYCHTHSHSVCLADTVHIFTWSVRTRLVGSAHFT